MIFYKALIPFFIPIRGLYAQQNDFKYAFTCALHYVHLNMIQLMQITKQS